MIVRVTPKGTVRLDGADDFRRFNVAMPDTDSARDALAAVARLDGRDHAWIDPAQLRAMAEPAAPDWAEGFGKMVGYAASKGWTDETGALRAHIEYE